LTIANLDILFYTLLFVVPGFIIDSIYRQCVPQKDDSTQSILLRFLLFSFLNFLLVFPLLRLVYEIPFIGTHDYLRMLIGFFVILLFSVIIALVISAVTIKGWTQKFLQKIGIHSSHIIPTAWDYHFRKNEHKYLTVYLQDGSTVFGYWGADSFASSLQGYKDIFLEKIFNLDENNQWIEIQQSKGVWVPVSTIKYIEFL
jgi:hypothetical protein